MITPTVGRIVWYQDGVRGTQAAIITHVWGDYLVNLTVFDPNGTPFAKTSITLVQEGQPVPAEPYCEWMPYQKAVASGAIAPVLHANVQAKVS